MCATYLYWQMHVHQQVLQLCNVRLQTVSTALAALTVLMWPCRLLLLPIHCCRRVSLTVFGHVLDLDLSSHLSLTLALFCCYSHLNAAGV
jgi:hypothetical protein